MGAAASCQGDGGGDAVTAQLGLFDDGDKPPKSIEELLWLASHGAFGILREDEVEDVKEGVRQAWEILSDLQWHTRPEIERRHPAAEAMRRVRDLRPLLAEHGWTVERRRSAEGVRVFEYRLAVENRRNQCESS